MVARLVRDQKVVGSSPVTSTITVGTTFVVPTVISWSGDTGLEGRQAKLVLRRSAGSTADLTAIGFCCQPCAAHKRQVPSHQPNATAQHLLRGRVVYSSVSSFDCLQNFAKTNFFIGFIKKYPATPHAEPMTIPPSTSEG